ncbi:MAG TPA: hypothetical protein VMM93_12315 [Vicinamibacterales bacterium]|nr:hypothetical protein [Vicinamibacterales bacterium]
MPRFLIEVPHAGDVGGCARVVETFLKTGSHFLTNADWGCLDGEHKAWLLVEAADRDEARGILPPAFRGDARVVELNKFSLDDIGTIFHHHGLP